MNYKPWLVCTGKWLSRHLSTFCGDENILLHRKLLWDNTKLCQGCSCTRDNATMNYCFHSVKPNIIYVCYASILGSYAAKVLRNLDCPLFHFSVCVSRDYLTVPRNPVRKYNNVPTLWFTLHAPAFSPVPVWTSLANSSCPSQAAESHCLGVSVLLGLSYM